MNPSDVRRIQQADQMLAEIWKVLEHKFRENPGQFERELVSLLAELKVMEEKDGLNMDLAAMAVGISVIGIRMMEWKVDRNNNS